MQLQQRGKLEQAREIYARILETSPQHPDALHLYGLASHQLGNHQEAVTYIRYAVEQVPDQPVLRNNLGDALRKSGNFEEALVQLEIALELRPDYAGAHQNLSSVYAQMGEHDAALGHAQEAVKLDAERPEAWFDLGLILLNHVLLEECVEVFRKALALRPSYRSAATSLLYCLNLLPGKNADLIAREHLKVMAGVFGSVRTAPMPKNHNERIRVGYVSGDFRAHAVNYFFEPVLESHDKARFEIYCYSDVPSPDHVTGV
jgi:protein O-GlcNAc transferase